MTDSPLVNANGPVAVELKSGGTPLSGINIIGIKVTSAINGVPSARLLIEDGNARDLDFPISDSSVFKPGADIEIRVGYEGEGGAALESVFSGVVVRHSLQIGADGSRLAIECQDKAFAMTLERQNRTFTNKKDSDIITEILDHYPASRQKQAQ